MCLKIYFKILMWFMQYPDEHPDFASDKVNFYGWLMQFKDGNRIDLHVESISHAKEHIGDDKLCKILLDKDNILPDIQESTDADYYIKCPSKEQFFNLTHAGIKTKYQFSLSDCGKGFCREHYKEKTCKSAKYADLVLYKY